ncbi:hypothetical protein AX16_005852 [Volvariella volvacea WC 439]|nr:hypothetical protein AX16_005852 [Volvariella volvacea WC 439]
MAYSDSSQVLCSEINASLQEESRCLVPQGTLAPISRLPSELLTAIIRIVVDEDRAKVRWELHDWFKTIYGRQLAISGVCRSWRHVILRDHILWTDIRTRYLSLLPMLLERSGTSPLSFDFVWTALWPPNSNELFDSALEAAFKQWHRVEHLHLDLSGRSNDPMPRFLWEPAPMMVHFALRFGFLNKDAPRTLFNGFAPRLTLLSLTSVGFSWDMPAFYEVPSLQSLVIRFPADRPSPLQLMAILRSMPNLRTLELLNALPLPNGLHPYPTSVTFHHLVELSMHGSEPECASFLKSTSFLTTATFLAEVDGVIEDGTYTCFEPWISTAWQHSEGVSSLKVCIVPGWARDIVKVKARCYSADPRNEPTMKLKWQTEFDHIPEGFVGWLMNSLPLSRCTRFSSNFLRREEWELCVQKMPKLEFLCISSESRNLRLFSVFVKALKIPEDASFEDSNSGSRSLQNIPFPQLKYLEVDCSCEEEEWDMLYDVLRERKNRGYELSRVFPKLGLNWCSDKTDEFLSATEEVATCFDFKN